MTMAWLEELLPHAMLLPRTRIWWSVFYLLFPVAFFSGVMLEQAQEGSAMMAGYEDRAASIRAAAEFAATQGFPVKGWHQYAIVETRDNLLTYYGEPKDSLLAAASTVAPAREVQVLFRSPDQSHEFRVYLSLMGLVTGYDFGKSSSRNRNITSRIGAITVKTTNHESDDDPGSMKNAISLTDKQAEEIARKALSQNPTLSKLVQLGTPQISTNSDDPVRRDLQWVASPAGLKGLTFTISVSVRDLQVVAEHIVGGVDKENVVKKRGPALILNAIYGFFLFFCVLYAIYRYAKRTLQKEVSHLRTAVVGSLFFISYGTLAYSLAIDQIAVRVSGEIFAKIGIITFVTAGITIALAGLLAGIGYGSGEGEVREAYPGKLTSLDALLAGRIFSRNVAASLLFGAAAAGWLLLCEHGIGVFLRSDLTAARSDVLAYTFARLPWLTLLVGRQYGSLLIAVSGLLLPASFLLRRSMRKRRRFAWLIVFAVCSVLHDASKYQTWASSLWAIVILVSALLLPFFAFDLLAAMVSLSTLAFVDDLARLSAVFPSWIGLAAGLAALTFGTLVVAAYLALRARAVREEDVQPRYARNLAERMSLQAEVLAAREAQLRLLPQAAPDLPGVQFAACCLPARGVGGDFYDFFRLEPNRVGIFVAQGGDRGLASALCIALAKGVLMHTSLQPHSPTKIVVDLEARIAELLEGGIGDRISFAYGVLDTNRNVLNFARLGSSPRFVVYRDGARPNADQLERPVAIPDRAKSAPPIYEGVAHVSAGDYLIFFTQGITSLRGRRFGGGEFQWLDVLMRDLNRPAEALQTSLVSSLAKYQNQAGDDLTAVVMRVLERRAVAEEVVA